MPLPHPEDILLVRNINTDDPDFTEYFQITWNGVVFRIPPGKVRRMPRYLAYHFCKHMTDRIIYRMDMEQFGRKMKTTRLRDQKLRDSIQRKCLIAVDQYYMADEADPQAQLVKLFGKLNPDEANDATNLGNVEAPLEPPHISDLEVDDMGNPVLEELGVIAKDSKGVGEEEKSKVPVKRSKKELILEAEELGIELEGTETTKEIQEKILAF